MPVKKAAIYSLFLAAIVLACGIVTTMQHTERTAHAQVSSTPATVPAGADTPLNLGIPCTAGMASSTTGSMFIQTNIKTGNRIWNCFQDPVSGTPGWVAPFSSPVLATATTGTFAAQAFILGGCTSIQTVTVPGAVLGTNTATASPIFATAPTGNVALLNVVGWVSAANTISVQGCASGTIVGTTPAFTAKVLMY
jgi:hypothetical protein